MTIMETVICTCLLLAYGPAIQAQPVKPNGRTIDGHLFAAVPLVPGKPDFAGIRRGFAAESQYATVQLADSLGTIYVYCGKDSLGDWQFRLLHHQLQGDWVVQRLECGQNVNDTLRTTLTLRPSGGRETPYPVELRLAIRRHEVYFRWLISPDYPNTPGGLPTAADVPLGIGKPIPIFTMNRLSGEPIRSSDLVGRITVVNWWATWCSGCRLEINGFNRLTKEFESRVDFVAIAINNPKELGPFLAEHPFSFQQMVASDSMYRILGSGIPRTVVLNKEGIVTFDKLGGGPDMYLEVSKHIEGLVGR